MLETSCSERKTAEKCYVVITPTNEIITDYAKKMIPQTYPSWYHTFNALNEYCCKRCRIFLRYCCQRHTDEDGDDVDYDDDKEHNKDVATTAAAATVDDVDADVDIALPLLAAAAASLNVTEPLLSSTFSRLLLLWKKHKIKFST